VHGLPVAFALASPKADERDVLIDRVSLQPNMFHHPDGLILVVDKGYRDRATETWLNEANITVVRPAYRTEPARPAAPSYAQYDKASNRSTTPSKTNSTWNDTADESRPESPHASYNASSPGPPPSGTTGTSANPSCDR
jgi:hypothetical protein